MKTIRDAAGTSIDIAPLYNGKTTGIAIKTSDVVCFSIEQAYDVAAALLGAILVAEGQQSCWHTLLPERGPYPAVAPRAMTDMEASAAVSQELDRIVAGFGR